MTIVLMEVKVTARSCTLVYSSKVLEYFSKMRSFKRHCSHMAQGLGLNHWFCFLERVNAVQEGHYKVFFIKCC